MKTKIPHIILAGLLGTAMASQGATIVFDEDFTPTPATTTGSGLIGFDGSNPGTWFIGTNAADVVGDLTLSEGDGRSRGGVIWLDPTGWGGSGTEVTVEFDVTAYDNDGSKTYFQVYGANDVSAGNLAQFDVQLGTNVDVITGVTGTASLSEIGPEFGITGTGTDLSSTFEYTGQDYIALLFFTMQTVTFDNITVAVPEPSSTALLGLGGLALMLRRKRS